ncbi:phosphatase and actin regulator 3 isoform X4 [Rhinolophus ferrumequinum]|uniref:Phosphatase and actin regulator n=1 Tax=Rhinolophus ferrumequinum TaxID=59479 RepID=A0A671FZM1_RHIFE|nr:phosphatase and actin regulator 3 isoform X3 [Rhinolophus ferrumequinum]XP_032950587.1 phosphatase and actin regulator 3 isoform X4 [Rhinolophus ferrumequinum]
MRGRSGGRALWPAPVRSLLRAFGARDAAASARGPSQDEMDPTPPVRSEYLVSGIRTPPVRRNSKLATLGRIFKPWKWRKKKNEKLKQTTSALEKKMAGRQGREELIKKGLLEMMEQDAENKACGPDGRPRAAQSEPSTPKQETLILEDAQPGSPLATGTDQASPDEPLSSDTHSDDAAKMPSASRGEDADTAGSLPPPTDESSQALAGSDSLDSPPRTLERSVGQLPSPPLLPTPLPKAGSKATKSVTGQAALFQGSGGKSTDPPLRGQLSTPTGSPHLTTVHRPLPPSRVIEELHRALATKHRQDSFQGRDSKGSPKKRVDIRLSRTSSVERGREREEAWSFDGASESKRSAASQSEENKENLLVSSELQDDLLLYQDEEALNASIISGTLPRRCKKELLAVKLRNRPSKQELEDRNIFPRRTDEERQEIRQQIEMRLSKRLSQRPAVEELERRNILKQRNDQTEQEERREIKQRLTRKLTQRPTVDELRDRKILIRFSDYVEVAKAQDYDRRADKPWTRLSAADKAAIRKELNEYKSNEMEVHASSKHLTRFHRP